MQLMMMMVSAEWEIFIESTFMDLCNTSDQWYEWTVCLSYEQLHSNDTGKRCGHRLNEMIEIILIMLFKIYSALTQCCL